MGNFDRFRVFIGSSPGFEKGTFVTRGDLLIRDDTYTPPPKKWASACKKAIAADPNNPEIFVKVFGVDAEISKRDPFRKTFSAVVGMVGGI